MYLEKAILKENHTAILYFDDGKARSLDFTSILKNLKNEAAAIKDPKYFIKGKADEGFLQWPNGYAIDPDDLYKASKPYIKKEKVASSFLERIKNLT